MDITHGGDEIVRAICEFVAAWNSQDLAARRWHLERSWSGHGRFVDPTTLCVGLEALLAYIGACRQSAPRARYRVLSIDAHHQQACIDWTLHDENRGALLVGHSVGEFDDGRRLRSLVTFHERCTKSQVNA